MIAWLENMLLWSDKMEVSFSEIFRNIGQNLIKLLPFESIMEIQLESEISSKIDKISKRLGLRKQALIQKIVQAYIQTLENQNVLKKKIKDWDALSDEALANFEESL